MFTIPVLFNLKVWAKKVAKIMGQLNIRKHRYSSQRKLGDAFQKEWNILTIAICNKLVSSLPKRTKTVNQVEGRHTQC